MKILSEVSIIGDSNEMNLNIFKVFCFVSQHIESSVCWWWELHKVANGSIFLFRLL